MNRYVLSATAAIMAAAVTLTGAHALDEQLESDTVVCLKNTDSDKNAVAVVYERYGNRRPNMREVSLAPGKTSCLRYRDARQIRPDFFFEGETEDVSLRPFKGVCRSTMAGSARLYALGRKSNGGRDCAIDGSRSETELRNLVRSAKAINS